MARGTAPRKRSDVIVWGGRFTSRRSSAQPAGVAAFDTKVSNKRPSMRLLPVNPFRGVSCLENFLVDC
jgi:hypothetical protein